MLEKYPTPRYGYERTVDLKTRHILSRADLGLDEKPPPTGGKAIAVGFLSRRDP